MSNNRVCAVWGTAATEDEPNDENLSERYSPRAGGAYFIERAAETAVAHWKVRNKTLLTDWLIEQRRLGVPCPKITSDTLKDVKSRRMLSAEERAINLLRYLERKSNLLGQVIFFYAYPEDSLPSHPHETIINELLAWTSSTKLTEVITLAEFCKENNWIDYQVSEKKSSSFSKPVGLTEMIVVTNIRHELMLKPPGYKCLADLNRVGISSTQCFVAMWFDKSVHNAYTQGIAPAIRECGYNPLRIDKKEHIEKIDDLIVAEIRRSRFVVADFTSLPEKPRGGVYYEAGFAEGLGIPVIRTCHWELKDLIHFDTRQFNHIFWKTPNELKKMLTVRIGAVIGDGPLKVKS